MRIITGKYKGKKLEGYDIDGTRPTMDRVKESMFAMIQNHVAGSACLDLFAGSGNLGFEALSEGAKHCYFIDRNPVAVSTIQKNGRTLGVTDEMTVKKMIAKDALLFLKEQKITFDLVFLDPPYQDHIIRDILTLMKEEHLLNPDALVVCEYEHDEITCDAFYLWKERSYGSKKVIIYQNREN